jgi:3-dehydroquinate dehydratase-1
VDIELGSLEILSEVASLAKELKKTLVISFHDFQATPSLDALNDFMARAKAQGADIAKVATTVRAIRDVQVLASLTIAHAARGLVVLGMGPEGLKTRLLLPALGSLMTFAYIDQPSAPGQLSVAQTVALLRALYPTYSE